MWTTLSTSAYVWPFSGPGEENDCGTDCRTEIDCQIDINFSKILGFKPIQSVYFQFDGVTTDKK